MSPLSTTSRYALGLFCVMLVLFGLSVYIRKDWVTVSERYAPGCGGYESELLIAAENWYREGFLHLKGAIYLRPLSIETSTHESRCYYASFPPGSLIPIYLVALAAGREPSLEMSRDVGLATHCLLAFSLTFMVFHLLLQLRWNPRDAFTCALVTALLAIFTRAPMYGYRLGPYFQSHSAAAWFAVYVALETVVEGNPVAPRPVTSGKSPEWTRRLASCLQMLCLFWGILNEWLFVFLAGCVYLNRLIQGRMGNTSQEGSEEARKRGSEEEIPQSLTASPPHRFIASLPRFLTASVIFFLPLASGLLIAILQIYLINGIPLLMSRFTTVTSLSPSFHFGPAVFWLVHIPNGFGIAGGFALAVSSILFFLFGMRAIRRRLRRQSNDPEATRVLGLMFVMLIPCLLYSAVFSRYVSMPWHSFSTLKFIIPFATIPLVLLPLLLSLIYKVPPPGGERQSLRRFPGNHRPPDGRRLGQPRTLSTAMLAIALFYLAWEISQYDRLVSRSVARPELLRAATSLRENTTYNDVVFSMQPEYCAISGEDLLPYSMKAVYPLSDGMYAMDSLQSVLAGIHDEYVVNIMKSAGEEQPLSPFLRDIDSKAFETITAPEFRLLKVHKADYLALCKEAAPQ